MLLCSLPYILKCRRLRIIFFEHEIICLRCEPNETVHPRHPAHVLVLREASERGTYVAVWSQERLLSLMNCAELQLPDGFATAQLLYGLDGIVQSKDDVF